MTHDENEFVPGHRLSAALYEECVRPALDRQFPGLAYAAALIGPGSDVLGYDTIRSTDHDWGPRLQIFVPESERLELERPLLNAIEADLPRTLLGTAVDLPGSAQLPGDEVTHHNSPGVGRQHGVIITSVDDQLDRTFGSTDRPHDWDAARWLTTPQQRLLEFTAGPLHHDSVGDLSEVRRSLAWYPDDLWLYLMSGRWQRIGQLEPFVGRCSETEDDLGSRVITASLVRDAMRLALLQRRRYPPYPKWLGTAFSGAESDGSLTGPLTAALTATDPLERQRALTTAMVELGRRQDALQLTDPLGLRAGHFFGRPYLVVWGERHARALHRAIGDPRVAGLPFGLGGCDEVTDSTDALGSNELLRSLAHFYSG